MSSTDLRAFELLLARGSPESKIDDFLDGLNSELGKRPVTPLRHFARKNGFLREQLPFLSKLYARGLYIDRRPNTRTAFVFFSTLLDPTGTAAAHWRLQRMNVTCIYLYDDRSMNFALGVRQCGTNAHQTDVAVMKCARQLRVHRLITIGSSAAAFTAIKRGLLLNAYACVTFSPFTTFSDKHHQQDGRGKAIVDRCRKLAPDMLIDLFPLLAERHPALKLVCFYAKGLTRDAWQAERVRSVRDTFMIPLNLETHAVLGPVIQTGMFDVFMQPLAEGFSVEDSVALCMERVQSQLKGIYFDEYGPQND
jgi:hypothetical protein